MKLDLVVPQVGESITSGLLSSWLKADGAYVQEGEDVFELETEKITLSVPAPGAGVLKISVEEGTDVEIGAVVGVLDTDAAAPAAEEQPEPAAEVPSTPAVDDQPEPVAKEAAEPEKSPAPQLSPAARLLIDENGLDAASVKGSGKGGQILKKDVLEAIDRRKKAEPSSPAPVSPAPQPIIISGGERREKMSPLRQKVAQNLVGSQQESAHLTTFAEIDVSQVMETRKAYQDQFVETYGCKLGFMSFFIKATQKALEQYPGLNAFVDGTDLLYHDYYNIGVAVSTDKGLVTPVIRDVDQKSFAEVEQEIIGFRDKVQSRKLMPADLEGGTFTVTNGGTFGSLLSTPIPSPPQSGILGMHTIEKRPVVVDDEIVIRPMMYAALTYDHRIVDGKEAVGFLMAIKKRIEVPGGMLVDL